MGRNTWIAGLALSAGVAGCEPAAAQTPQRSSVQVLLKNDAGVPADVLEQAKRHATRVFDRSRITLEWIEEGPYQSRSLTLRMVAKTTGIKTSNGSVMGSAPGTREARGILAFVFYERIRNFSADLAVDVSLILGHVMAHELGHLLLPYDAHSHDGVMRGVWDPAQANQAASGRLIFSPAQAALIRERLSGVASPIAPTQ